MLNPLEQVRSGIARGVAEDPDVIDFRCGKVKCRLTHQSGGVYGKTANGQGLNTNTTPYIFTAGEAGWEEGEVFSRRGRKYQIGTVSRTEFSGGVVSTQAQVTEITE